jgi:hypothetical protein
MNMSRDNVVNVCNINFIVDALSVIEKKAVPVASVVFGGTSL